MSDTNLTLDYFEFCRHKYKELKLSQEFCQTGPLWGLRRLPILIVAKLICQIFLTEPLLLFCFPRIKLPNSILKASVLEDPKSILPSD